MLIFIPVLVMLLTALALAFLRYARPQFKYPWILAVGGSLLALASVFFWRLRFPQAFSLPSWKPETIFTFIPSWLADEVSFPYALSLAALAAAVILTSVVRAENEPMSWAGTLLLSALGILAAASANPLTLVLAWSILDLSELVIMVRSTEGELENQGVVTAFAVRLAGMALLVWANVVSSAGGTQLDFLAIPPQAGIYLLIAAGLRLGVLPLHLPYRKENVLLRGFGTTLRLVSAVTSLVLLARIPKIAFISPLTPYLLILAGITALYAAWMWLRSSDEIAGRPFWVMAAGSMAVAASLRGNPMGSVGWGVALVLAGGLIFLFSARQKNILWLALTGLWLFSSLPFSLAALAWSRGNTQPWALVLPFLPAQAFLLVGYLRHALLPGETSLESQEKWTSVIYPAGLFLLASMGILLGLWGWTGARSLGPWWDALIILGLAAGAFLLTRRSRKSRGLGLPSGHWTQLSPIRWLYAVFLSIYRLLNRVADLFTGSIEGEGGLLWSFLLLVLIISVFTTLGR